MPHLLGPRLRVADDGRSAEIFFVVDVVLSIYLGESFHETSTYVNHDNVSMRLDYGNGCTLDIFHDEDDRTDYYRFRWIRPAEMHYLKDTFKLSSGVWFGGAAVPNIKWPIDGHTDAYTMSPHVVSSIFIIPMTGQQRYWLGSNGLALHVPNSVPLWTELDNGYLKFQAQTRNSPYKNFQYVNNQFLEYEIAVDKNQNGKLRDFHQHMFVRYLKAPKGIPDEDMVARPIWSTWARYKKEVTQEQVIDFLAQITSNELPISNMELDDKWAPQYGDFKMDTTKFFNFSRLNDAISSAGARLTLWIHPFINAESRNGQDTALRKYFVHSLSDDNVEEAALGEWWDGERAYSVDFTSTDAVDWYNTQLRVMQEKYNIFAYKFDAGELNTLPNHFVLRTASDPNDYARAYAKNAASFGNAVEVRVGSDTQDLPIFYRTMDRNSNWKDMGLETLIPSVLHCSLHGYFWMLPDMVGGNGYNDKLPPKELFIRWAQANTFLLTIQFSYAPFDYDNETVTIVRNMLNLRLKWLPYIVQSMKTAAEQKEPVIRPMWWASEDARALNISNQFLLGDNLLVAPMIEEFATKRSVFIPEGSWQNENTQVIVTGPESVDVEAPLEILPHFSRLVEQSR